MSLSPRIKEDTLVKLCSDAFERQRKRPESEKWEDLRRICRRLGEPVDKMTDAEVSVFIHARYGGTSD